MVEVTNFYQMILALSLRLFLKTWCSSALKFQVLTNGIEVKLQRNALSVIEPPTGNEDDDKFDCENMQWNSSDMGKLPGLYFFFLLQITMFCLFHSSCLELFLI